VVEQLAQEYSDRPVVFLEQDVDSRVGDRYTRWWAAFTGDPYSVYLPLVMADSGHRISNGSVPFAAVYRSMVDAELARPPEGRIEAWSRRVGDGLRIYARVTNLSDDTLSAAANEAAVHALVWEDVRIILTNRTVRAAPHAAVGQPLPPGAAAGVTLDTGAMTVGDWDDGVHTVVFGIMPAT